MTNDEEVNCSDKLVWPMRRTLHALPVQVPYGFIVITEVEYL